MKYIKRLTTACCAALLMVMLASCEGADLYDILAPDWLQDRINEAAGASDDDNAIEIIPNPSILGNKEKSTGFLGEMTDDVKIEPGETYRIKFTNYGGPSNWCNFIILLRNGIPSGTDGYYEYGVFRADNWCWNTTYTDGAQSDNFCTKKMESDSRDWAAWLAAMSKAKCTATITNKGDGTAEIGITMLGSDGNTYKQNYVDIKGIDPDDLYFTFSLEKCYIVFGDVAETDEEPVSMTLNNVPKKVLQGTDMEALMSAVTATVEFADGSAKTVDASELQILKVPNTNTLGQKGFVAVYNKTSQGNNCTTPVIATAEFEVVDKMYTCVGATNNSSEFFSESSEKIKVAPGETYVTTFTNYTAGGGNYQNFMTVLTNSSNYEYGVLRADNWCWGSGFSADEQDAHVTKVIEDGRDWATWLAAMDGAKVTVYVTNTGDGTADVKYVMVGNDSKTYTQEYKGLNTVTNPDDFYVRFSIDHSHIEFDDAVGADDNSTEFFGARSTSIKVPAGKTYMTRFKNYSGGGGNYQNFLVVLTNSSNYEYGVLRADNWCWGSGFSADEQDAHVTKVIEDGRNWETWLAAMEEAVVTVHVTNKGNGKADVKCEMVGKDGKTYIQNYIDLNTVTDSNDFNFQFTVDHCHLTFE